MATVPQPRLMALSFWQRMALGMSVFIVLAFAQFGLRGMVDYARAPLVMHLHGAAMVAWLFLLNTQALLARRPGTRALHQTLGLASLVMVPLIVVLAITLAVVALRLGMFPQFFTAPYFLALVIVSSLLFAGVVGLAIARRRQADWHKRLMVGSTILLLEPALGRVLPMPFIMPWGEWLSMAIQLGVVWLIARHDRRETGFVHPATVIVAMAVVMAHVLTEVLALVPWWQELASRVAA